MSREGPLPRGRGLCPGEGSLSRGGASLKEGSLSRGGVSVQMGLCPGEGSLSRRGLCPGVSVQRVSVKGVSVQEGLCPGGGFSVWGRGLYPGKGLCPGGLCLGKDLCPGGGVSFQEEGSLSRGISVREALPYGNV